MDPEDEAILNEHNPPEADDSNPPDTETPPEEEFEYDDDGNLIEPEPEAEPEAETPPEAEAEPVAASVFVTDPNESPEEARLREMLEPDVHAAIMAVMDKRMNNAMQSMTAAQGHVAAAAAENPELFRVYGAKLSGYLAEQEPGIRSQKLGVNAAVARLVLEEAQGSDIKTALTKIGKLVGVTATAAPRAPKPPIPAAQRPPSASGGTQPPVSNREARVKMLMSEMGLSRLEAEESIAALSASGRSR